jgi:hypothetical protein
MNADGRRCFEIEARGIDNPGYPRSSAVESIDVADGTAAAWMPGSSPGMTPSKNFPL